MTAAAASGQSGGVLVGLPARSGANLPAAGWTPAAIARVTPSVCMTPGVGAVVFAVSRNCFEAQTGRNPGDVDVNSTKRKGLAGAWKADMPQDLQDRFLKDFGRVLAAAGYDA